MRGGKTRLTCSSGKNIEPLESKPDILEDDKEESKQEKNNKMKEKEEEVDKNKERKQTARWGKCFLVGQTAGKIRKMLLKIKECKIALSQQDNVKLEEISEEKNINKTKLKKGVKVVDNEMENDVKKEEIKPVESKDEETEEKENEKVEKKEVESDIKEVSDKDSKEDKTENNGNVEEDKTEQKNGCHIQHMAGYVNNGETF